MNAIARAALTCTAVMAMASCFSETEDTKEMRQEIIRCDDPWDCDANTPYLGNGVYFWELHAAGQLNDQDIEVLSFTAVGESGGVPLRLKVERDELTGYVIDDDRDETNDALYSGSLVGAVIALKSPGSMYYLRIDSKREVPFKAGTPEPIDVYDFRVSSNLGSGEKNLCAQSDEPEYEGVASAMVFAGDRYDPQTKTVTEGFPEDNTGEWFNIACAGSAMAKAHRARHTAAGGHDRNRFRPTKLWQRTAFIKMITADYCGTGDNDSFTVQDQPLAYMDVDGRLPPVRGELEGMWNKYGLLCLDAPRLGPVTWRRIQARCGGTPQQWACGPGDRARAYLFSFNPLD